MFDIIADVAPFNYRLVNGCMLPALYRTRRGFSVEHYFFEARVRRDDEKEIIPDGWKLRADRTETRCYAERPCEGERALRSRYAERNMYRFLHGMWFIKS